MSKKRVELVGRRFALAVMLRCKTSSVKVRKSGRLVIVKVLKK